MRVGYFSSDWMCDLPLVGQRYLMTTIPGILGMTGVLNEGWVERGEVGLNIKGKSPEDELMKCTGVILGMHPVGHGEGLDYLSCL